MNIKKRYVLFSIVAMFTHFNLQTKHDILIETRGNFFLPTHQPFQQIYGNCGEFGFELTGQIVPHVYGFASSDFVIKAGQTVELQTPTSLYIANFGIGLKYFVSGDIGDLYVGIGAQPTYLSTVDKSTYVQPIHQRWTFGGIVKAGAILNMHKNFFTDIFIGYSFAQVDFTSGARYKAKEHNANLDAVIAGIGIGYRFN